MNEVGYEDVLEVSDHVVIMRWMSEAQTSRAKESRK